MNMENVNESGMVSVTDAEDVTYVGGVANAAGERTAGENSGTRYGVSESILPRDSVYTRSMKKAYFWFLGVSLSYGVIYAFCMYRNPAGITFPLLVVATLLFAALCLKKIRQVAAGEEKEAGGPAVTSGAGEAVPGNGGGGVVPGNGGSEAVPGNAGGGAVPENAGGASERNGSGAHPAEGAFVERKWFKSYTLPYLAAIVLLGISTCLTANDFFHFFNKVAIVMLFSAAMLHQLYEDGKWSFPVYMRNLFVFWGSCITSLGKVFSHSSSYRAGEAEVTRRKKAISAVLKGVGLACLVLLVVLPLLISSDLIIVDLVEGFLERVSFVEGFCVTVDFFVGLILFYAFFAGLFRQNIDGKSKGKGKKAESLTGITFISILAVVYVFYAAVQIVYLFLRAGALPDGLTYSEYAHEGFWQLLAVSLINIVMILICMQAFQKHKILNVLLLVISLCTCVMTASAAYRMILYVGAYHLTFLRILVLWFLGVLSLVMAGMMVAIFKESFPLFQYSVAVLSCCYIAFSFVRVDAVIASYNIKNTETMRMNDVWYLMSLSEDAAFYIAGIEADMVSDIEDYENWNESDENFLDVQKNQYFEDILRRDMSPRQWNYGMAEAKAAAKDYLRGE